MTPAVMTDHEATRAAIKAPGVTLTPTTTGMRSLQNGKTTLSATPGGGRRGVSNRRGRLPQRSRASECNDSDCEGGDQPTPAVSDVLRDQVGLPQPATDERVHGGVPWGAYHISDVLDVHGLELKDRIFQ